MNAASINVESVLNLTREECLRGMQRANDPDARRAWYYTHSGELHMAAELGAISWERMNELHREWREHNPDLTDAPSRDTRAIEMTRVAQHVLSLLHLQNSRRDIGIEYFRCDADNITRFTPWQIERNHLFTGMEYFLVWNNEPDWDTDKPTLLYAVNVSADSILTAAYELTNLLSAKF